MDWSERNIAFVPVKEAQADFLRRTLTAVNPESKVTRHDMRDCFLRELSQSPNAESFYTPYTLLRLLIDKIDDIPDKLLYLDTDTVAVKDITELYQFNVSGYDFAAAQDYLGKVFISPRYMNAGVMLLNVQHMKKSGLLEEARALCCRKKYPFPDQDVLNHCEKHKLFLPRRFNEQKELREDTVIRHFSKTIRWFPFFHTLNIKPWDEEGLHNVYKTYAFDNILSEFHKHQENWEKKA